MEGGAGFDGIEQIAFEIEDLALLDQRAVEIGIGEFRRRAEIGVHGALAVRRHQDEAAAGRRFALASPSLKTTPMERRSCSNTLANWSWPTLPMKPALPPSEAMPAQVFAAEPPDVSTAGPILVKRRGFLRRGQAHGALVERELIQQRLLAGGDDVDERVADAGYLQGLVHEDGLSLPLREALAFWVRICRGFL